MSEKREMHPSANNARQNANQGAVFKTVIGGILFLLPIIVIVFLLSKAVSFARRVLEPVIKALGWDWVGGGATVTLIAIAVLLIVSYAAGLFARTALGGSTFSWVENSVLSLFPQWRLARAFIESFEAETRSATEVVLVPTDAGWCLGFVLEKPEGDWWTIFVPGSPQWLSGSVAFAHGDQVRPSGLTPAQAIMLMRRCGEGSANIRALLASLQEKGAL